MGPHFPRLPAGRRSAIVYMAIRVISLVVLSVAVLAALVRIGELTWLRG
jgi:hypothetical protein